MKNTLGSLPLCKRKTALKIQPSPEKNQSLLSARQYNYLKKKVLHLEIDWYLLPIDTQQAKITLGHLWDILISFILYRALQSCEPIPTPACYGDKASWAMSPGKKDARISQCLPLPTSLKSVRKISQSLIYFFPAKIKLPSSCLSCWEHQEIELK